MQAQTIDATTSKHQMWGILLMNVLADAPRNALLLLVTSSRNSEMTDNAASPLAIQYNTWAEKGSDALAKAIRRKINLMRPAEDTR